MESLKSNHSIGMRFKMRFEGEEAPEQRFTGTIVGIGDADPNRWHGSKWRCLKVRWDETSSIPRPERVSPWKIEPAVIPPTMNSLPLTRPKRLRSNVLPSSPDSSVLTKEASLKVTVDPSQHHGLPRVLQDQQATALKNAFPDSNESNTALKPGMWSPMREKARYAAQKAHYQSPSGSLGFCSFFNPTMSDANLWRTHYQDQEGKNTLYPGSWPLMPVNSAFSINGQLTSQAVELPYQKAGNSRYGGQGTLQSPGIDHHSANWFGQFVPSQMENLSENRSMKPQPSPGQGDVAKPKGGASCKLFGIQINSRPETTEPAYPPMSSPYEPQLNVLQKATRQKSHPRDTEKYSEPPTVTQPIAAATNCNMEKKTQPCQPAFKDVQSKLHGGSTRSCTKVHKQGIALGRSVDLTKFNNYDELIAELDRMFEFEGELKAPTKNWLVVYTDDEGDMMLVGDDPWPEFCRMVRKIFIYTREEVQKVNPATLNSGAEESTAASEGKAAAVRESKGRLFTSTSVDLE